MGYSEKLISLSQIMPKIIGNSKVVVDDGAGLTINELVGNVATNEDKISIAHVKVANPASEPWLTLHYDEYICVLAGKILVKDSDQYFLLVEPSTFQCAYQRFDRIDVFAKMT